MSPQQRAFLAAFRETGNVRLACEAAKVGRSSHYRWLEKDPEYSEAFDLTKEDAADLLEAEAVRRAVEGVEKPAGWYKGVAGGTVREYSDVLLILLMKAVRPEKFRDRQEIEINALRGLDVERLPDAALARIAAGENILGVLVSIIEAGQIIPRLPPPKKGTH